MRLVLARSRWFMSAVVILVTAALATPLVALSEPSTPEIEAKKSEASQAQAMLDDLQAQLELRTEELAGINAELQKTRGEIEAARAQLEVADRDLAQSTEMLESRAAASYRSGDVDVIEVLLGTTSFQDFLTRLDWLRRVSRSDASLVASVKEAREKVRLAKQALERREDEQITLRDRAKVKQKEVQTALADQDSYVKNLNAEVAKLVKEEQARQDALAAERARVAREAAAKAAAAAAAAAGSGNTSVGTPTPVDPSTLGSGHSEVVDVALQFLGTPYHWAASGPGTCPTGVHSVCFDCSGLTWYCYKQIGITIPRSSSLQFSSSLGSFIPADRTDLLEPGDLVFFGYNGDASRVHHVGMYVGNGDFIHAPSTGRDVMIQALSSRDDYVGARRF